MLAKRWIRSFYFDPVKFILSYSIEFCNILKREINYFPSFFFFFLIFPLFYSNRRKLLYTKIYILYFYTYTWIAISNELISLIYSHCHL